MEKRTMGRWFYGVLAVLMGLMCFLFWKQITVPHLSNTLQGDSETVPYYSDMSPYLQEGIEAKTDLWYALIGPLVFLFYKLTGSIGSTSFLFALALAAANGATICMVRKFYCIYYKKKSNLFIEVLSLSSVFVSMLLFPPDFMSAGFWYLGSKSPNVWHNPTLMLCRPFSLWVILCVYQMLLAYREHRPMKKYIFGNMAAAFLSMWAKPSFLVVFLPVLCLYLLIELIKTKGKSLGFSVKLGLSFVPSMLVVLYQYLQLFTGPQNGTTQESGMQFGCLQTVPRMMIMTVTSSLFILAVGAILLKYDKKRRGLLGYLGAGYLISWMMCSFMEETGVRAGHGNFDWSFIIVLFCLFAYGAGEVFIREDIKLPRWQKIACMIIYGAHLITGVLYFAKIFAGGAYF